MYKYQLIPDGFQQKVKNLPINQNNTAESFLESVKDSKYYNIVSENIEQSIGIKELFKNIKQNRDFCVLYIPSLHLLSEFKDSFYPSKNYFYAKNEELDVIMDMRPEIQADTSHFSLGLICKVFFNLDIHLQQGINYINFKQCEQIINSMFSLNDALDHDVFSKTFISNFGLDDVDDGLRFDSYEGVLGLNFGLPFPFRLIFSTCFFNFYQYYDIDEPFMKPFKQNKSMINFLFYSNQINCIYSKGLLKDPNIKEPPAGLDWNDPVVNMLWKGKDRDINSKIDLTASITQAVNDGTSLGGVPQFGVYIPKLETDPAIAVDKYVFDFLRTAIINNKINNTSIADYEFVLFEFELHLIEGSKKVEGVEENDIMKMVCYLRSSDTKTPLVFMYNYHNFNLMITNQPKKRSLFFSIDNITRQIKDRPGIISYRGTIPGMDFIGIMNTQNQLLQSNGVNGKDTTFYFNIAGSYTYIPKSIRIVKLYETDCIKITPDLSSPTESVDEMPQYKFNFTYEPFNRSEWDLEPSLNALILNPKDKREKTGIDIL